MRCIVEPSGSSLSVRFTKYFGSYRGLFATHYHRLADAHEQDAKVAICHMGCSVEPGVNGGPEQVCNTQRCTTRQSLHMARVSALSHTAAVSDCGTDTSDSTQ